MEGLTLPANMDGLPTRVTHLEGSVTQLHQDSIKSQAMMAAMQRDLGNIGDALKSFGDKLDQQRTKRPDIGAFAGWAAVILTMVAMAYAPLAWRMSDHEATLDQLTSRQFENSQIVGEYSVERQHVRDAITRLENKVDSTQSNRFTKEDGERLNDKIDRMHEPE